MTGPEHFREAERLLSEAAQADLGTDMERYCVSTAQVYATLALAAATVDVHRQIVPVEGKVTDWHEVLS